MSRACGVVRSGRIDFILNFLSSRAALKRGSFSICCRSVAPQAGIVLKGADQGSEILDGARATDMCRHFSVVNFIKKVYFSRLAIDSYSCVVTTLGANFQYV